MKKKLILTLVALVCLVPLFCFTLSAESDAQINVSTYAYNLSFENEIYIAYAVKVDSSVAVSESDVGLLVWKEGTERTDAKADANLTEPAKVTINGNTCYMFKYTDFSAKMMKDIVAARPYVNYGGNKYYGEITEYSVCMYAERKLGLVDGIAGTPDPEFASMLKGMLEYGAAAQKYFDYKTEHLATEILDGRINVTYEINIDEGVDVDNPNPTTFRVGSGKVELLPLTAKGYTFMGWCVDTATGWEDITEIDTSKSANIKLIAVWQTDRYSITYKNTMGVLNDNDDTYTVLDWINLRPLEKYDYTFNGWRYDNAYGEFVGEDGIPAGTTGNITLYADWTLKPDFENMLYVVDDEYKLPNGQKFCMLTGVLDSTVTKVEISPLFNHIKEGALEDCHWLTELSLPYLGSDYTTSNYTNVGYLFGYGSNAEAEGAIPTSLRKLTVTGGMVGDYAFANLKNVAEIVLTPEVTSIGYKAFSNCEGLEDLTMPLLYVNDYTRRAVDKNGYRISQAEYYGFPGCVDRYDDSYDGKTFKLHINGGGIHHAAANAQVWEHDGAIIGNGFGGNLFELCKGISEVTIDNITVIPQFAFAKCSNLKKVTIGDTVQNIMSGAFWCTAIEEIVIPDSVKEMGEYWYAEYSDGFSDRAFGYYSNSGRVFASCKSLRKVIIGNGVVNIPAGMFEGCTNLEEITIGENVRFVDNDAFSSTNDTFNVINNSKHKEWVVSGPVSERFMNQLMAGENAPEKIYYGYDNFEKNYDDVETTYKYFLSGQKGTEEQIKKWNIVFYSPTDPYAEGGASSIDNNSDIEYWYHDDGADWYRKQYTVTPKLWEKPQS